VPFPCASGAAVVPIVDGERGDLIQPLVFSIQPPNVDGVVLRAGKELFTVLG
jgi:hypothetical protein